ncbi:MAG TPA: ribosome recycling factor [bacterium]|nr:ribosome recycling factor [bacterium]
MDPKIQSETKQKMDKTVESLRGEFSKLRTGRASVAILDGIRVDSYGSLMALNQVASLSVSDSRTIVITPWDKSLLQEIERSIHKSELGLQPVNDGKLVRLSIPPLTEERRKDLVKVAKRVTEEARVSIRNARREANETVKKVQKDGKISEDDLKKWETEIQKMTDQYIVQLDTVLANKEKEIMEI